MSLEYSYEALLAKPLFNKNKIFIYVEGIDDIPFWTYFFEEAGINCNQECDFNPVNGHVIQKFINELSSNDRNFLIAIDRDYNYYLENNYTENLLISTPCHSIENIIFCQYAITRLIRDICGLQQDSLKEVKNKIMSEMNKFKNEFYEIVLFDILNQYYNKNLQICSLHYENLRNNLELKKDEFRNCFLKEELENSKNIRDRIKTHFFKEIRGHFLEGWAIGLIKSLVKKYRRGSAQSSKEFIRVCLIGCKCGKHCLMYDKIITNIKKSYTHLKNKIMNNKAP